MRLLGALLAALALSGCTVPVYVNAAGRCPVWSEEAIDDWDRIANDPATPISVVEAIGRWITYCEAVEAALHGP